MLVNSEEEGNSLRACPVMKKPRKRSRGKKHSAEQTNQSSWQNGEVGHYKTPIEGTLPEENIRANAEPTNASTDCKSTADNCSKGQQTEAAPKSGSYNGPRPGSPAHEEIRLYLDKLREMVPHAPSQGKLPRKQLIQHVIDHICGLQQALDNHPGLRGLDPRVLAAPGGLLSPMQRQQQLLQQRNQHQFYVQQQQQQQQLLQQQQRLCPTASPYFSSPYARKGLPLAPVQPASRPTLQVSAVAGN